MNLYQAVHKLRQIYRSIAPRPWLIFWKRTSEIKINIICNLTLFCRINMLQTKSKFWWFKSNHTLAKVFHFSSNNFAMIPPSNIFKCSSFVPASIIMIAELQSRKSLDWLCKSFLCKSYYCYIVYKGRAIDDIKLWLTCLTTWFNRIKSSKRICRTTDIWISPKLFTTEFQHFFKEDVSTEEAG